MLIINDFLFSMECDIIGTIFSENLAWETITSPGRYVSTIFFENLKFLPDILLLEIAE